MAKRTNTTKKASPGRARYTRKRATGSAASRASWKRGAASGKPKLLTVMQVQADRVHLSDGNFYRPAHGHVFNPGMRVPAPSGSTVRAF